MTAVTTIWYRERWVWLLIAIPGSAVLFGIAMLIAASLYRDDVVVADYYREGMAINRSLAMAEEAGRRGVRARVVTNGPLAVELGGADDSAIVLRLAHVTTRALDREFLLTPDATGRYTASGASGADAPDWQVPGTWNVELIGQDHDWRLTGRVRTPVSVVELTP